MFNYILDSIGLKRRIASFIAILIAIASGNPELEPYVPVLVWIGSFFGVVGLTQAAVNGTLTKYSAASVASFFTILLAIAEFYPPLAPFISILQKLAALFGAATVGTAIHIEPTHKEAVHEVQLAQSIDVSRTTRNV